MTLHTTALLVGGIAIGLCLLSTYRRPRNRYTLPEETLAEQARAFDKLPLV